MCKQSSTIIKLIILFTIAVSSNAIFAQFFDDFSDGDFITNPTWEGNVSDFIINDAGELQLNANEAGESYLYTNLTYPDTIQMDFLFRLEMSPSSSNFGLIYLGLDNIDPEIANGYYIQIGESGSEDAIRLFNSNLKSWIIRTVLPRLILLAYTANTQKLVKKTSSMIISRLTNLKRIKQVQR